MRAGAVRACMPVLGVHVGMWQERQWLEWEPQLQQRLVRLQGLCSVVAATLVVCATVSALFRRSVWDLGNCTVWSMMR